jgi:1-deoxy-D-xylulose-5-phosphate reductoisomerase
MKQRIAILGSTGSIGTQSIDVISKYTDLYTIEILTAHSNAQLLIEQARKYLPNTVVIADTSKYGFVNDSLSDLPVKVFAGHNSICDVVCGDSVDIVIAAMVGFAGLKPVINAIENKKKIALANKETLVVAGSIIKKLSLQHNVPVIPIDSEHSAIFQCLMGEYGNEIEKIILTASGGPFRNKSMEELKLVSVNEALHHPNWNMGAKISIDSATMMNKGLEVIEAHWLFDVEPQKIDVVVHPQSIVHSLVQFADGSVKAQMGLPDMHLPIQYALSYPIRLQNNYQRMYLPPIKNLEFFEPDVNKFSCLTMAYNAIHKGGNMPCVLNAANEIAVQKFLNHKIRFNDISEIISETMQKASFINTPSLEDLFLSDEESRKIAFNIL